MYNVYTLNGENMNNAKVKITQINTGVLRPGDLLPRQDPTDPGNVGREVLKRFKSAGYQINRGKGANIQRFGADIKTRNTGATSPYTIANSSGNNIKANAFDESSIADKIQSQIRVNYTDWMDPDTGNECSIVDSIAVYDFADPMIQDELGDDYEVIRGKIAKGDKSKYITAKKKGFYMETQNPDAPNPAYQFRCGEAGLRKIDTMSSNSEAFNANFEVINNDNKDK